MLFAGVCVPGAASSWAADAPDVIDGLNAQLLATMKQAQALGVQGRYDALAPVLSKTYDIASMTRMAVGPDWEALQPAQKAALTDAFSRMMIATYAKRFDGFSGEAFKITEVTDRATDKMVKTQIVQSNGKPVPINYLMRKSGPEWRVVDVYLDGTISELASRRAEFTSILKSGGPDALIASLRKQGDRLLSGS
ncbi:hopanoid biosynthesis associated membrane protein HpnM [Hyphomicrobium denitrificans 1NES1]|uniref:Hopanoid biosynthesis associated membrane protein HpnM n=1 Tax=Hyphomicrobium denitrificans 1NES1 TaxID=670307 RepID=N0B9C3_9HYPH|nr:hopanoid biosynthesis associated membrane protein HpnM [Hyphomicrobium denitrificans 1NES1]